MAWDDTQSAITEIGYTDWNTMVSYIKSVIEASNTANVTTFKINGTSVTSSAAELNILDGVTATATQLNYLNSSTSDIQTQLNSKLPVELVSPVTDLTYSGLTRLGTAGEILALWDLCYLKSDGKFWKANGTLPATTKGHLALSTGAMAADGTGQFLIFGYARNDIYTFTIGGDLYVGSTAGNPTQTAPTGTGKAVRIVGQAYSATVIFFNPDNTYVELT